MEVAMTAQIDGTSGLIVHKADPLNAEPPLARLRAAFLTPQDSFYIRSHGETPRLDAATHSIRVEGVPHRQSFTLAELQSQFAHRTVTAVMQCAGNRRADMHAVAPVSGDPWAPGAIGNARWTGAALADILLACGVDAKPGWHVAFACADACELDWRWNMGIRFASWCQAMPGCAARNGWRRSPSSPGHPTTRSRPRTTSCSPPTGQRKPLIPRAA